MHTTVAFSELSLSFLGILNFFILALALIALHREHRAGTSLIGFGPLVVAVLGLCTFTALYERGYAGAELGRAATDIGADTDCGIDGIGTEKAVKF